MYFRSPFHTWRYVPALISISGLRRENAWLGQMNMQNFISVTAHGRRSWASEAALSYANIASSLLGLVVGVRWQSGLPMRVRQQRDKGQRKYVEAKATNTPCSMCSSPKHYDVAEKAKATASRRYCWYTHYSFICHRSTCS